MSINAKVLCYKQYFSGRCNTKDTSLLLKVEGEDSYQKHHCISCVHAIILTWLYILKEIYFSQEDSLKSQLLKSIFWSF